MLAGSLGSTQTTNSSDLKSDSTEQKPLVVEVGETVSYMAFSPDSTFIVTAYDKCIRIWNCHGALLKKINLPYLGLLTINGVRGIAISPAGEFIFASNTANRLQKWSVDSGALVATYKSLDNFSGIVSSPIIITPDGKSIICVSSNTDEGIILDFETGTKLRTLSQERGVARAIAISSDGLYIVSGRYSNGNVNTWDFKTGALLKTLQGHSREVQSVAITSDNRFIVSGSGDNTLRIWDLKTGASVKTLEGHTDYVNSVTITSDNRFILSGSGDGTVRIWDLKTGDLLKKLEGHSIGVLSIAISPDGQYLASGDANGKLLIWDLPQLIKSLKKEESKELVQSKLPEVGLLKNYLDVLEDPSRLSIELIQKMFVKVKNVEEFKLPYTLTNIALRQNPEHKAALQQGVYQCLEKLTATCIVAPAPDADQKDSSKKGSLYIAQYKLALDSALKKGFISKAQQYYLDNQAEDNKTFSDERFTLLEQDVQALKKRVELTEHNVSILAENLNALKESLRQKSRRSTALSFAKIGIGFIAGPLVGFVSHIFDLSDISEMGAALLKMDVKEWDQLVAMGADKVKENMDSIVESAVQKMGYDPEELFDVWVKASLTIEVSSEMISVSRDTMPGREIRGGNTSAKSVVVHETQDSKMTASLPTTASIVAAIEATSQPDPFASLVSFSKLDDQKSQKNELKDSEAIIKFKQKLTFLMKHEDGGFSFLIKRQAFNCLQLQFTAADKVLMVPDEIRKELIELIKLFKQAVIDLGIKSEQYKIEPNWKEWTLVVTADPAILNKVGELLHSAGANYFESTSQAKAVLFGTAVGRPLSAAAPAESSKHQSVVACIVQ